MILANNTSSRRKIPEITYERKYLLDPNYMTKRDLHYYYKYYNVTKNRTQYKKVIAIFCVICFFSYIFIDFNLKTKFTHLKDRFDFLQKQESITENNNSQAYFVDTKGCRMPFFNYVDDNILQYMFRTQKITCNKTIVRTNIEETILNINKSEIALIYNISDVSKISCYYQEFKRKTDNKNEYLKKKYEINLQAPTRVVANVEFIGIFCHTNDLRPFYKDFHFFPIQKRIKIDEEILNITKVGTDNIAPTSSPSTMQTQTGPSRFYEESVRSFRKHRSVPATFQTNSSVNHISVMIIGIDSVSRLNFLRQMTRTASLVKEKLQSIEFMGYNKVGDNTYPNLIPVLSGLDVNELNLTCLSPNHRNKSTFDNCAFIWRRFKQLGYSTVFAEDVANVSLFNYFRQGFKNQPTDYYLRPMLIEMERNIAYKKKGNFHHCLGSRRPVDVVLDLIHKLIPFFQRDLFFSFFWMASLTHDFLNMPTLLDDDIAELFETLYKTNVLNRTILFFMSDHGLRWGSFRKTYQGMMEERQPMLISIFPESFAKTYPNAVANMRANAKRLTTHYDLHATLLSLLDLRSLENNQIEIRSAELQDAEALPRGISLFLEIPPTRTCENAGIASHWCTCHEKETLPTNDARVQRAARYIVKLINDKLRGNPQCRMLYLNSIHEAIIGSSNQKILKEVTSDYLTDITVRVQTKPGLGEFESTVRMSSESTHLTGTISRINIYGSQSYCIDDYTLKMFCYCHR